MSEQGRDSEQENLPYWIAGVTREDVIQGDAGEGVFGERIDGHGRATRATVSGHRVLQRAQRKERRREEENDGVETIGDNEEVIGGEWSLGSI